MLTPRKIAAQNARRVIGRIVAAVKSTNLPIEPIFTVSVFEDGDLVDIVRDGTPQQALAVIELAENVKSNSVPKFRISADLSAVDVTVADIIPHP